MLDRRGGKDTCISDTQHPARVTKPRKMFFQDRHRASKTPTPHRILTDIVHHMSNKCWRSFPLDYLYYCIFKIGENLSKPAIGGSSTFWKLLRSLVANFSARVYNFEAILERTFFCLMGFCRFRLGLPQQNWRKMYTLPMHMTLNIVNMFGSSFTWFDQFRLSPACD